MNRIAAYSLGPELVWLLMLAITALLVFRNQPATEAGNLQLEHIGWFLPIVGVLLSFVSLAWAPGSPWWVLARIILAGGIGIMLVPACLCGGIDYGDSRNSGVGSGYIMFVGLGLMTLFVGSCIAVLFLATKWPFMPVLKWMLIVVGVLAGFLSLIFWLASFGNK
ncbi:hypothetical protein [Spirosoma fluminis]